MEQVYKHKSGIIGFTDQGRGEVIVLLHGYLETSAIWDSFARKLSEKFRVIAVDLPGHGRSGMFGEIHTMEFMADAIREMTENKAIDKFFLAGHSLGGYVTLAFADLFPERLSGYCLFHSHPFADSPEALEKRDREIRLVKSGRKDLFIPENVKRMFAASVPDKFPEFFNRSLKIAETIQGGAITAVLEGMKLRPSRQHVMEKGKIPLLWILGARDNYINCDQVQSRITLPGNARAVLLKNSGHMGFIEEEEESLKSVIEFIGRL